VSFGESFSVAGVFEKATFCERTHSSYTFTRMFSALASPMDPDRRQHPRFKVRVPVEFFTEGSDSPIRGATSDLSLGGCYIETVFPFAIGTRLELKLQVDGTLLVIATVATSDPQVGNGIQFTRMLPEDIDELRAFLDSAQP
jgi:hypothetical protein